MDPELQVSARAESLLYAAARAQLVEEAVSPLLEQGTWVLLDRFVDSSLAYQGAGRELGMEGVALINDFATGGLQPDRTLLLVLDLALARVRSQGRAAPSDRLEREEQDFFARTNDAYLRLASAEPDRIRVIHADAPPEEVLDQAWDALRDLV